MKSYVKAMAIYDSDFGNTEQITRAIWKFLEPGDKAGALNQLFSTD